MSRRLLSSDVIIVALLLAGVGIGKLNLDHRLRQDLLAPFQKLGQWVEPSAGQTSENSDPDEAPQWTTSEPSCSACPSPWMDRYGCRTVRFAWRPGPPECRNAAYPWGCNRGY